MNNLKTALLAAFFALIVLPHTAEAICLPTTIQTTTNETSVTTCPGDGVEDKVKFRPSSFATAYRWIITDTDNVILDWFYGSNYDFEPLGEGVNRVWGISYSGSIEIPIGENIFEADFDVFCHIISDNFILVNRIIPDAGIVSLDDSSTTAYICPNDGQANVLNFTNVDAKPGGYAYIITDVDGIVAGTSTDGSFDFETLPEGTCLVYGMNYAGDLIAAIGDDIAEDDLSDSCFDLSDDAVTIVKATPIGAAISIEEDNSVFAEFCTNDGQSNILNFANISTSAALYNYLITDEDNVLLGVVSGHSHDFETAPQGVCRVYGLSYTGNLTATIGEDVLSQMLSSDCWNISVNYVEITRHEADGGMVSLLNGETVFMLCPDNGISDFAEYENNSVSTANYAYLITDTLDNILAITLENKFDFDGAGEGICRIYGISYWEDLTTEVGENITDNVLASECYEVSTNYIEVIREIPNAGEVSLSDGGHTAYTCPGDGNADEVSFANNSPTNSNFAYFITDADNHIIGFSSNDTVDFEGAGTGICRVWGVAYTGSLVFVDGDSIQVSTLSDDCYDVSENFVEIIRENPVGGSIQFTDDTELKITCTNDGNSDLLYFKNEGASNSPYVFIITDVDDNVIALETESFDFEGGELGFCWIYGAAYTGNITLNIGDNLGDVPFSDDCFDYAINALLVIRTVPDGATVSLNDGGIELAICSGDDVSDEFTFDSNTSSEADYIFIITDENDIILAINNSSTIDFEGAPEGICRVYGLSYTGTVTAEPGDFLPQTVMSDDCYDLSTNYVEVIRTFVDGGEITANGEAVIYTCPFDQVPNVVNFETSSAVGTTNYSYIITNSQNIITAIPNDNSFDFEDFGIGISQVYGISHNGDLIFEIGDDITNTVLADGCYELSSTFLEVITDIPNGDFIVSDAGSSVNLCVNDGVSDIITFQTGSFSFVQYAWVLTDGNDIIEDIYYSNVIDFDETMPGAGRVYGLSYTGNIIAFPGTPAQGLLSDDCFNLSNSFIELNRTGVDGATIFLPNNSSGIAYTCPGDGNADFVGFFNTSSLFGTDYKYVVTDTNNAVLAVIPFNLFDFESFDEGICRVWGISYTGNLDVDDEDLLMESVLSTGCYEVSENFVTIIKVNPEGGEVTTEAGETEVIIEIDNQSDSIFFVNTASDLAKFRYVITDDNDMILAITEEDVIDFNAAGVGVCRVYGLSFTGSVQVEAGDILTDGIVASGCWDLSDNFVTIIREEASDGLIGNINNNITTITNDFLELKTYPNPVSDYLNIRFKTAEMGTGSLLISNSNGQVVYAQEIDSFEGENNLRLDVGNWHSGYYFIHFNCGEKLYQDRVYVRK